jgi:hypothetical protein
MSFILTVAPLDRAAVFFNEKAKDIKTLMSTTDNI